MVSNHLLANTFHIQGYEAQRVLCTIHVVGKLVRRMLAVHKGMTILAIAEFPQVHAVWVIILEHDNCSHPTICEILE